VRQQDNASVQATRSRIRRWTPALVFLIAGPVSVFVTLLLTPLWRRVEATTGMESIGHSGPSGWCFVVTFVACLFVPLLIWLMKNAR
jgi:hypothetical protein